MNRRAVLALPLGRRLCCTPARGCPEEGSGDPLPRVECLQDTAGTRLEVEILEGPLLDAVLGDPVRELIVLLSAIQYHWDRDELISTERPLSNYRLATCFKHSQTFK